MRVMGGKGLLLIKNDVSDGNETHSFECVLTLCSPYRRAQLLELD